MLSSIILFGAMLLQSLYGPKPNVPVAENTKAVTTLGEEAPADASDATNADQTSDDGTSPAANAESQNAAIDGTEQAPKKIQIVLQTTLKKTKHQLRLLHLRSSN